MPGGVQTSMKKAGFGAELSAISIPEVERLQLTERTPRLSGLPHTPARWAYLRLSSRHQRP